MDNSRIKLLLKIIKSLATIIIPAILTGIITNYFTEGEIMDSITTHFDFVDKEMSYKQALEAIYQERKEDKDEIESLNEEISKYEALINQQNSTDEINKIIQNATQYWNEANYQQCLTLLKNSKSRSTDIDNLYTKYSAQYVLILLSNADSFISQRKYNEAIELLNDGTTLVDNDKMLSDKIDEINNNQPIKLSDLKISASRFFTQNQDKPLEDTVGNKYSTTNSFITYAEGKSSYGYATFYLGKKYTALNGIIAISDESENRSDTQLKGWIEIGTKSNDTEFNSLWSSSTLSRTTSQIEIPEINIKDSEWLEIRYYNNGEYFILGGGYHSLRVIISDVTLYVD